MPEIEVRVVGDTIHDGVRITSIAAIYPRFILAQVNTHRMIARSSRSSRAVPAKRLVEEVRTDPVMPMYWGRNKPGMQAEEELSPAEQDKAREVWLHAAKDAAKRAEEMAQLGVHKQLANRLLEPFLTAQTVMTATEWDNFFALRLHEDAQPEMQALAGAIKKAMDESEPEEGDVHLPFLAPDEREEVLRLDQGRTLALAVSAARCARVSYKLFDGSTPTIDDDVRLAAKLLDAGHMSPFDHPAEAIGATWRCRHLVGWAPARHFAERKEGHKPRHLALPEWELKT